MRLEIYIIGMVGLEGLDTQEISLTREEMEAQRAITALEGLEAARVPVLAAMAIQEPYRVITEVPMVDTDQEANGVAVEAMPQATPSSICSRDRLEPVAVAEVGTAPLEVQAAQV
jgi:hypothetical protein